MGITGFELKLSSDQGNNKCKIIRENSDGNPQFETLSEGEKTLITFLYFIRKCEEAQGENNRLPLAERVIVIDDPISSLSYNYVLEISSLIRRRFLDNGNYKQVLILTHHLYFAHELLKSQNLGNDKKENKKHRLVKNNGITEIKPLNKNDIKNTYEAHWQVIRDYKGIDNDIVPIANSMRNIIEYFFTFIKNEEKYRQVKESLEKFYSDGEIQHIKAFFRFVDKGSHSDSILQQPFDVTEFDQERFLNYFKDVFEKSGYSEHYNAMMKTS